MKKLLWIAAVLIASSAMVLTSCQAAGKGGKKGGDKGGDGGAAASEGAVLKAGEIVFKFKAGADTEPPQKVNWAGELNGWNPGDPSYEFEAKDDGTFVLTLEIDPGTYPYKFVLDGQWPQSMQAMSEENTIEPKPTRFIDDGYGGKNAVIEVE
ncbi:MAG: hypothetical protein A2Y33_00890 [Spirochaetes bacterium GWF1_51_8]|nr:MAG: hypothetical protein A2Y33_00890 [Spirochaetes bacterium GWF1_51_8]